MTVSMSSSESMWSAVSAKASYWSAPLRSTSQHRTKILLVPRRQSGSGGRNAGGTVPLTAPGHHHPPLMAVPRLHRTPPSSS